MLLFALSCTGDDGGNTDIDELYEINDRVVDALCEDCGLCNTVDVSCQRDVVRDHADELGEWIRCATRAASQQERCVRAAECDNDKLDECLDVEFEDMCEPPVSVERNIEDEIVRECNNVIIGDGDGDGFSDGGSPTDGSFECDNGSTISRFSVCNELDECGDGSDETIEACTEAGRNDRFECADETTINQIRVCDGTDDCGDFSDETLAACNTVGKTPTVTITMPTFECVDGTEIPLEYVCDTEEDCANGEDEVRCFDCDSSSNQTVRLSLVCDGVADCLLGEDEAGEGCMGASPGSLGFVCGNGQMTLAQFVCDGRNDCDKGDDEEGCLMCPDDPARRYRATMQCDGITDCADHSDEQNCGDIPTVIEQCVASAELAAGELADEACLSCTCEASVSTTLACDASCWAVLECAQTYCGDLDGGDPLVCVLNNCPDFEALQDKASPFVEATADACRDVCPLFNALTLSEPAP